MWSRVMKFSLNSGFSLCWMGPVGSGGTCRGDLLVRLPQGPRWTGLRAELRVTTDLLFSEPQFILRPPLGISKVSPRRRLNPRSPMKALLIFPARCGLRAAPPHTSSLLRGPILSSSPRFLFRLRQATAKAGHLFDKQARSRDPQTERRPS